MRKVLFFDKLDYFSIILIFFLKIFYKRIYFRDANNLFKKEKIKKLLKQLNIFWISHLNLDCKYYNGSISIRKELEQKFINNQIKESYLTKSFSKKFNLDMDKLKKYYLCIRGELLHQGEFMFESSSITLMDKFIIKKNFNVIYFPKDISSYLLALENDNAKIKINSIYCFYSLFYKTIIRIIFKIYHIVHQLFLMH